MSNLLSAYRKLFADICNVSGTDYEAHLFYQASTATEDTGLVPLADDQPNDPSFIAGMFITDPCGGIPYSEVWMLNDSGECMVFHDTYPEETLAELSNSFAAYGFPRIFSDTSAAIKVCVLGE